MSTSHPHFRNKVFTSAGTESGIFLLERGGSNRDWFSLELKLDDFTSGFQTTYADAAGGWEEFIAMGGGIGTGAGTGVELNKKGKADEVAENNGWADLARQMGGRARPLQSRQTVFG